MRRDFDKVMAWSVDRLGRSLSGLPAFMGELKAKSVDLYLHQQHLDTATPAGKAMFQMLGVFSEFEREIIRERVNSGLARAKAQGKKLGRRARTIRSFWRKSASCESRRLASSELPSNSASVLALCSGL